MARAGEIIDRRLMFDHFQAVRGRCAQSMNGEKVKRCRQSALGLAAPPRYI